MSDKTVKLTDEANGKSIELPLVEPTLGASCIDIAKLYKDTGHYTFDPGFAATASTKSAITYIDGEKGPTLKGEHIAEEFQGLVEEYVARTYARKPS